MRFPCMFVAKSNLGASCGSTFSDSAIVTADSSSLILRSVQMSFFCMAICSSGVTTGAGVYATGAFRGIEGSKAESSRSCVIFEILNV